MSERVLKFGKFLKGVKGAARIYPWTPYAEKYREILAQRLHVRVTVDKFQIRVRSETFFGMYTGDTRVEVAFPITAKKRWIIRTKPRTSLKMVDSLVSVLMESMKERDLKAFEHDLNTLLNYLDTRFSLMIYEYNIKPSRGRNRVHRSTGKARILPMKVVGKFQRMAKYVRRH